MSRVALLTRRFLSEKLTRDIAYTLFSFAVLAASGMVINLVIALLRDASALGVFNQSYAVYIMASQFATFGLHYSVLRYTGVHDSDDVERGRVLGSAAVCALAGGFVFAVGVYAAQGAIGAALDSGVAGAAIGNAALGLALFPLNKVLLNYLNALRRMRAYSLLQAGRYLVIMLLVTAFAATAAPVESITFAFLAAELVTALVAISFLFKEGDLGRCRWSSAWVTRHLHFGGKGLAAGAFAEFNSRVDVLIIGVFLPDRAVGVYSFAAMMADGVYHLLAMVRINFNPILIRAMRDGDWREARSLLSTTKRYIAPAIAALVVLVIAAFWMLAELVLPSKGLSEGLPSLVILLGALCAVAAFVPFDNLMLVTGHPGRQTMQQLVTVTVNVLVGVLLLQYFGLEGVALGTAFSYAAGALFLIVATRRLIGWNLLTNSFRA